MTGIDAETVAREWAQADAAMIKDWQDCIRQCDSTHYQVAGSDLKRLLALARQSLRPAAAHERDTAAAIALGRQMDREDGGYPEPVAQGEVVERAAVIAALRPVLAAHSMIVITGVWPNGYVLVDALADAALAALPLALAPEPPYLHDVQISTAIGEDAA